MLKREAHRLLEQHNAGLLEQVESLQVLVDDGRVSISKLSKHNDSFQLQLQDFAKHNARLLVQVSVHILIVPVVGCDNYSLCLCSMRVFLTWKC